MTSEPRSSVAFLPNALAGLPDTGVMADPYAPGAQDLGMFYNGRGARGAAALVAAPFVAGYNVLSGAYNAANELMRHGYQPGADDDSREGAIKNSLDAAGIAGTGGFAASRLVGDAGSLGTFIGGIGARNLERAGRRTGQQALEMARLMEAQGASPEQIRAATNRLIESGDPLLGGVSKGRDEMRRLELSDEGLQAKLGTGYDRVSHPEFEAAYPGVRVLATVKEAPESQGGLMRHGNDFSMTVAGPTDAARRNVAAHEYQHIPQMLEPGFAQGADYRQIGPSVRPTGLRAGQVVQLGGDEPAYLKEARRIFEREPPGPRRDAMARAIPQLAQEFESARAFDLYQRLSGEAEARAAMARLNLTPAERRARLPELDEDVPRSMQIPWKD